MLIGDRDLLNSKDVFRCYTTDIGLPLWEIEQPTDGKFDYGETPRATPLIHGDLVYLLGAFGHLHCVRLATGEVVWKKDLRAEFGVKAELPWGYCGSPLLVGSRLIVTPGGADASIVALNASDGKLLWKTTGGPPSYGSMITGVFGGVQQIVGHDATTLGGWDVETGKRLWTIKPKVAGDFNVPTPIQVGERLLVTTENNGTRLYKFKTGGQIEKEPVMFNSKLHPDMTTPVVIGDRVFCISSRVHCLDLKDSLKHHWTGRDAALGDYSSLIADNRRILVTGVDQLLLLDATADSLTIVSRLKLFEDGTRLYSHPALVGTKLFVRGEASLVCIDLAP